MYINLIISKSRKLLYFFKPLISVFTSWYQCLLSKKHDLLKHALRHTCHWCQYICNMLWNLFLVVWYDLCSDNYGCGQLVSFLSGNPEGIKFNFLLKKKANNLFLLFMWKFSPCSKNECINYNSILSLVTLIL